MRTVQYFVVPTFNGEPASGQTRHFKATAALKEAARFCRSCANGWGAMILCDDAVTNTTRSLPWSLDDKGKPYFVGH